MLDDGDRFCDLCAAPLTAACSSCGVELRPDAKFCGSCGHAVDAPADARPTARKVVTVAFVVVRLQIFEPDELEAVAARFDELVGSSV